MTVGEVRVLQRGILAKTARPYIQMRNEPKGKNREESLFTFR